MLIVSRVCVCVPQVVEQGMFVKHCKVEVYLTELKLCEDGNMDNMVTRRFSKADTIGTEHSLRSCPSSDPLTQRLVSVSHYQLLSETLYLQVIYHLVSLI